MKMKEISNEKWKHFLHIMTKFNSAIRQAPKPALSLERDRIKSQLAKIEKQERENPPISIGMRQAMIKDANRLKQVEYDRERGAYGRSDEEE